MTRSSSAWLGISLCVAACGESERQGAPAAGNAGAEASTAGISGAGGSTSSEGGKPSAGGGSALDEFPAQYAEALCALFERCWASFGNELAGGETCESVFERGLREGAFSNVAAAVADGRVEYRAESAQGCLDAVATASCEDGMVGPDECDDVFVGSLQTGDACTLDAECAGAAQCVVSGSCPGECAAPAREGEACTSRNRCEPGLICLIATGDLGICTAPADPGAACSATLPCPTFFYCAGLDHSDPTATGTCEPRDTLFSGGVGEPCTITAETSLCEPSLVCAMESQGTGPTGVCRAGVGSGEACPLALPDACPSGEYCHIDTQTVPLAGVCTASPAVGDACLLEGNLAAPCPLTARCSTVTGLCEPQRSLGESCTEADDCFSSACVDDQCVALLECELEPT